MKAEFRHSNCSLKIEYTTSRKSIDTVFKDAIIKQKNHHFDGSNGRYKLPFTQLFRKSQNIMQSMIPSYKFISSTVSTPYKMT